MNAHVGIQFFKAFVKIGFLTIINMLSLVVAWGADTYKHQDMMIDAFLVGSRLRRHGRVNISRNYMYIVVP